MENHCDEETTFLPYNQSTNLPMVYLSNSKQIQTPSAEVHHARVLKENNINLTALQKELLCWHFQLCHQGFDSLQQLLQMGKLGSKPLIKIAANCELPKCASCKYAKAKCQSTATSKQAAIPSKQFPLKKDQLYPGQ